MSRPNRTDRPYDIVLFGATGFVGSAHRGVPRRARARRAALGDRRPRHREAGAAARAARRDRPRGDVPLLRADVADPDSLRALAEHARVVATTVGPYITYGEELVAACADAGTDYLDLTGEPEFVDLMYVRHDARARETGARLVHACGFDSIPHDLGALLHRRGSCPRACR